MAVKIKWWEKKRKLCDITSSIMNFIAFTFQNSYLDDGFNDRYEFYSKHCPAQ